MQIHENLKTANLNPKFTGYKKAYSQILIFRANINNFTSFAAIDAIKTIETIQMPALKSVLGLFNGRFVFVNQVKKQKFSCFLKLLLQFIFNIAN